MKTIKSRSTTSRKKKLAVRKKLPSAFPKRVPIERDMTDAKKIKHLERELHGFIMRERPPWFSIHGKRELALRNVRKQNRELNREVTRLNALVIKLAEKI